MKALVGPFNQEKALVGAFSVIVKTGCGTDGALHSTTRDPGAVFAICAVVVVWRLLWVYLFIFTTSKWKIHKVRPGPAGDSRPGAWV